MDAEKLDQAAIRAAGMSLSALMLGDGEKAKRYADIATTARQLAARARAKEVVNG
jgi:hypothetical protein